MSEIKDRIQQLIAKAAELPPDTVPQVEIAARFDPTEYSKTKPIRDALDSLFNQLKRFDTEIDDAQLDSAPPAVRAEILNQLNSVQGIIEQTIASIQKQEGNVGRPRLNESQFRSFAANIGSAEAALFKLFALFRSSQQISGELLNQAVERAYAEREKLEKQTAEASQASKDVAATVLSLENVDELNKTIIWHSKAAKRWLLTFGLLCAVMLRMLVWISAENDNLVWPLHYSVLLHRLPENATGTQGAIFLFGKVLLVSFGLGLCILAARVYQTHSHNVIVNKQRRIASISFLQLYKALDSSDPVSRQELVKQAAQAIFAHTSTGFLHKSGNEFAPFAPFITQLIRRGKTE